MAFNVSALTAYTEANKSELLIKSVMGAPSLQFLRIVEGIKGTQKLGKLTASTTLQAGGCNLNPAGSTILGEATITVEDYTNYKNWCVKDLDNTIFQPKIGAGALGYQSLPDEEKFIQNELESTWAAIESAIWLSDTAGSPVGLIDGFYKQVTIANGAVDAGSLTLTTAADVVASAYAMVTALPVEVQSADDLVLYMSAGNYNKLMIGLMNANLYHFNADPNTSSMSIVLPGTNVTVVKTNGLGSKNRFYIGRASNFIFGTDLKSDFSDRFDLFFDPKTRTVDMFIEFKMGVTVGFISEIAVSQNA